MELRNIPCIAIALPCYNEEEVLPLSIPKLTDKLAKLVQENKVQADSFIVLIDDGSRDRTWSIISNEAANNQAIKGLKLSRNSGHQAAILSGMMSFYNRVDCVITLDVDLQDDIDVIDLMVAQYRAGSEIVYGIRKERKTDSFFKRSTAQFFYKLIKYMGVEIIYNHSDYRLSSTRAISELKNYEEKNLFLRGIYPLLGFQTSTVEYARLEREAGTTKYPLRKMLSFALDGITSFSIKPLRLVTTIGVFVFIFSILLGCWSLYRYAIHATIPGWTSMVLPIYFLGGIQLLAIGILGEYLGKIYKEVKNRPLYIVEKIVE
jgi:glycosyltransferase involved in cell wall biosynthesis